MAGLSGQKKGQRSDPIAGAFLSPPVLIIGGGLAGLAAAVELVEQGRRVLLLERRSFLGGRAYSFTDQTTGDTVDNGQHLLMGCYHHTLNFLARIGALSKLKIQAHPRVDFLSEEGDLASFRCPPLPAPLHLLAGLARLQTIGWRDRLSALRVGWALRHLNGDRERLAGITVREWLNELGQSEQIQRRFWDLVALATLNELPERASADMFARVLERAFMQARRDSTMIIPRVSLSELYTTDARRFIEERGSLVRLNAEVAQIKFEHRRAVGVVLRSGETLPAEAIISALPYFALKKLISPDVVAACESLQSLDRFQSSPIVSINLWYEEPITELEFVGLLDSPIDWVFNKNAIGGVDRRQQHLALVTSGAYELADLPKEALVKLAVSELRRFFPAARKLHPIHYFVIKERDATLSHTVGLTQLRPAQRTSLSNFFLAGDWTATGLPATIEGAVWSGQECARALLGQS